jgi:hypothetical protein
MEDIENYIKSVVTMDPRNRRWKTEDKQLVIDALTKNADGMYGINTPTLDDSRSYCNIGSDGYIARCTIFVAATQPPRAYPAYSNRITGDTRRDF